MKRFIVIFLVTFFSVSSVHALDKDFHTAVKEANKILEEARNLSDQKMYEEDLVCNAIIRGWMHKKGFTGDEVFMQGPEDIPEKQRYNAFKQVQMAGPEKVIDYYGDDEWDLENFLDGSWRL